MKVPSFFFGMPQELIPLQKRMAKKILRGARLSDLVENWVDTDENEDPLVLSHPSYPFIQQFQFGQLAHSVGSGLPDGVASPEWMRFIEDWLAEPWSFLMAVGPYGALGPRPERHLPTLRAALQHLPALHAVGPRFADIDPLQTTSFWQRSNAVVGIVVRYDFSVSQVISTTAIKEQLALIEQAIERIESGVESNNDRPLRS
jgi:hypothetical protein